MDWTTAALGAVFVLIALLAYLREERIKVETRHAVQREIGRKAQEAIEERQEARDDV